MSSTNKLMRVSTPELLWHGGGNEHGKPDPIYSLDYHPTESVLLTTGIDASTPPKGSVRLWKIDPLEEKQEFLFDFSDHQDVVNIARFSPCGKMIASASEKQIVIYTVLAPYKWEEVTEMRQVERNWIRPTVNELFDLEWSPDSTYISIASISGKGEVIRIATKDSLMLPGHTSYVQGISWDPLNKMIATQSSDRSCKIHMLKYKENVMLKLAPRGHVVLKMNNAYQSPNPEEGEKKEGEEGPSTSSAKSQGVNLFADSNVPSFFRRLSFTPDGALLIIPTGIHRNPLVAQQQQTSANSTGKKNSSQNSNPLARSFCTHIYHRDQLLNASSASMPALSLVGLEDPSVAIRVNPRLYKFISGNDRQNRPMFSGDYRMIFAVVTVSSVLIYDTQHPYPILKFSGLHYAAINDAAWSGDGSILSFCSSDGYVTFVRFSNTALGELLEDEAVPEEVKRSHPRLYNYSPPQQSEITATEVIDNKDDRPDSNEVVKEGKDENNNSSAEHMIITETEIVPEKQSPFEDLASIGNEAKHVVSTKPDIASPSDPAKKKKRIQPTVISNLHSISTGTIATSSSSSAAGNASQIDLTHHSGSTGIISLVDDSNDFVHPVPLGVEILPPIEPTLRDPIMDSPPPTPAKEVATLTTNNPLAEPAAKKKRIAPMLVSSLQN